MCKLPRKISFKLHFDKTDRAFCKMTILTFLHSCALMNELGTDTYRGERTMSRSSRKYKDKLHLGARLRNHIVK